MVALVGSLTATHDVPIVLGLARTGHTRAISAQVAPLRIATAKNIFQFLADTGEIGFTDAAVAGNQRGGYAMRLFVGQTCGQLLPNHGVNTFTR